ncbi:MAG: hypothetical protein J6N76_07920, partial [Lachnospiraceae bacterium]|nr:hypothetical protein [Lachnospiraceae bacterium]
MNKIKKFIPCLFMMVMLIVTINDVVFAEGNPIPFTDPDPERASLEVSTDTATGGTVYTGVARYVPVAISYGWQIGENPVRTIYDGGGNAHNLAKGYWNGSEYHYEAGTLEEICTLYEASLSSDVIWMIGGRVR